MREEAEVPDSGMIQSMPSELRKRPPRNVRINSTAGRFWLIIGLLLLGMGSLALVYLGVGIFRQVQQQAVLRSSGREAVGVVTGTHGGHGNSTVSYRFTVDGVVYFGRAEMPPFPLILQESEGIVIRYLPSDPALNHPAAWEWSNGTNIIPDIFVVFFTAIGGFALLTVLKERHLARVGTAAEGVVVKCARHKRQFRVEYRFGTGDAGQIRGSCDSGEEYQEGDHIWIIYLPGRPRRNHSYPLAFVEIAEE